MASECSVCCETTSKPIVCGCDFVACKACAKRYVLDAVEDAHCMNCRRGWPRDALIEHFGPTWVSGEYKQRRETLLFDRERAMLPDTQARLETYRRWKSLKDTIDANVAERKALKMRLNYLDTTIERDTALYRNMPRRLWTENPTAAAADPTGTTGRRDRILCGCPSDGCIGFVTASKHQCGTCGQTVCKECHVKVVDDPEGLNGPDGHVCAPGDVATAKLLSKDTKPCPRCKVPIFRSSGCPQMFCTRCNCVFDWISGKEQTGGAVHNPHYFEWRRQNGEGGAAVGIPRDGCGGGYHGALARLVQVSELKKKKLIGTRTQTELEWYVRRAAHVESYARREYDHVNRPVDYTEMRLKLLNKETTEKAFRTVLQRDEKRKRKDGELRDILGTFCAASYDIVLEIFENGPSDGEVVDRIGTARDSMGRLETYVNAQLARVSKVYGSKKHEISTGFGLGS